jgi:hypothetical protein
MLVALLFAAGVFVVATVAAVCVLLYLVRSFQRHFGRQRVAASTEARLDVIDVAATEISDDSATPKLS